MDWYDGLSPPPAISMVRSLDSSPLWLLLAFLSAASALVSAVGYRNFLFGKNVAPSHVVCVCVCV